MLFFSGAFSALLISVAYVSPTAALPEQLAQLPTLPSSNEAVTQANPVRVPDMVMRPMGGRVTVRIINQTGEEIDYQALGDTDSRTLDADSAITLQDLHVPATVTFAYSHIQKDRSTGSRLIQAELSTNEAKNHLDLVIQPTDDIGLDTSNLTVESGGT